MGIFFGVIAFTYRKEEKFCPHNLLKWIVNKTWLLSFTVTGSTDAFIPEHTSGRNYPWSWYNDSYLYIYFQMLSFSLLLIPVLCHGISPFQLLPFPTLQSVKHLFYVTVHFSETEDLQWKTLWFLPDLTFCVDLFTSSISKATIFTWTLLSWHTPAIEIFIEAISTDTAGFTLCGYLGKANRLQSKKNITWDAFYPGCEWCQEWTCAKFCLGLILVLCCSLYKYTVSWTSFTEAVTRTCGLRY